MLFSSLIRRSFGSRIARSESNTRTYSALAFFHRYPSVLKRLTIELRDATNQLMASSESQVSDGLHPCLTLLSRLDLAPDGEDDGTFEDLLRYISTLATCANWQIRSMAAQAVPTFVDQAFVGSFIVQQLNQATTADQNALHGRLLMIYHLLHYNLERHNRNTLFVEQVIGDVRRAITNKFVQFTSENSCAATEALWLRILLFLAKTVHSEQNAPLRQRVVDYCSRELASSAIKKDGVVGSSARREAMTSILMRALADPEFKRFQSSSVSAALKALILDERPEIRLRVYQTLPEVFKETPAAKSSIVHEALQYQSLKEPWAPGIVGARVCLTRLPANNDASRALGNEEGNKKLLSEYLKELQLLPQGSPRTNITLSLIGNLIDGRDEAQVHIYKTVLHRFGHDDQSADTRSAALRSLFASKLLQQTSTDAPPSGLARHIVNFLPILLRLLTDDDEEIRQETAGAVCRDVLSCTAGTPERTRELLIGHCTRHAPDSQELQETLISDAVCGTDPASDLRDAMRPSELLFAIEKQNLWRNEVSNCAQALDGLATTNLTRISGAALLTWCMAALEAIRVQILRHERDGPLGWTSISDTWQIIRRSLLVGQWIRQSTQCTETAKTQVEDKFAELRLASMGKSMHPSLLQALER